MKNYYKDINYIDKGGFNPYVKVNEGDLGAQLANDGFWYVSKDIVDLNYPDGTYYLDYLHSSFFEPIETVEPPTIPNKQLVEEAVDEHVYNVLTEYWYKSIGEVAAMAINLESIWNAEAIALNDWYNEVYELLAQYKEGDVEMTPQDFIATLPIFEL